MLFERCSVLGFRWDDSGVVRSLSNTVPIAEPEEGRDTLFQRRGMSSTGNWGKKERNNDDENNRELTAKNEWSRSGTPAQDPGRFECTSRGPGFDSRHPYGSSQPSGSDCHYQSWGGSLFWLQRAPGTQVVHRYTCRQNIHTRFKTRVAGTE